MMAPTNGAYPILWRLGFETQGSALIATHDMISQDTSTYKPICTRLLKAEAGRNDSNDIFSISPLHIFTTILYRRIQNFRIS